MIITCGTLGKQKVMQAYPLMQEIEPGLEFGAWFKYASSLIDGDEHSQGIFGALRGGYVRGVFCYQMEPGFADSCILQIRNFVVLDLVEREAIADILYQSIGDIAQRTNSRLVQVHLPLKSYWAAQKFENKGYRINLCTTVGNKSLKAL